jgi:hypothetical protein
MGLSQRWKLVNLTLHFLAVKTMVRMTLEYKDSSYQECDEDSREDNYGEEERPTLEEMLNASKTELSNVWTSAAPTVRQVVYWGPSTRDPSGWAIH